MIVVHATLGGVNSRIIGAAVVIALLLIGICECQTTATPKYVFSAEDDQVPHPARIPDAVFTALKQSGLKAWSADDGGMPEREWFSAEMLQAPSAHVDLYMVMAAGPLRGANVNEFWLVRYDNASRKAAILWDAAQHDVWLRYRPGTRYPDIHAAKMSAVRIWQADFRMSGDHYILVKSKGEDIQ
jgi:hypothetical protein